MNAGQPRTARVLAIFAVVIAAAALLARSAGIEAIAAPLNGTAIRVNTVVLVILIGVSLAFLTTYPVGRRLRLLGLVLAGLATAASAATLLQYVLSVDLGLDQFLSVEPPGGLVTRWPGRMAPNTAAALVALGVALLLIDRRTRGGHRPSDYLALFVFAIALLAATDFIFRSDDAGEVALYRQMSAITALCLLMLSLAILSARPGQGVSSIVESDAPGGVIARRLLPAVVVGPCVIGWLRLLGERAGVYDTAFGATLMVTSTCALLSALVLVSAATLNRAEAARRSIESERARIDGDLRRTNRLLDAIIENIPFMIFMKEAKNLTFSRFNRAGEELLGLSREALLGKSDYDLFPPEQAEFFQQKDRQTLASGEVLDLPEEPIDSPGGRRWLHTKKVTIVDDTGQPAFLLGISEDITLRKEKDEQLQKWAAIFEHAHWGVVVGSADGQRFELMNAAFAKMHGYEIDELLKRPIVDVFAPEERPGLFQQIERAHEQGQLVFQAKHLRKDGTVFPALINLTAVKDSTGHVLFRAVNVQDITSLKRAEEELRRAKDAAEATSRELEAFSYSVSHDLRSPLRSIDGFSQALVDDYGHLLDDAGKEHLTRVRGAAQRMAQLIDDLLDLSRVARSELRREMVSLTSMAQEICAALERTNPERAVRFVIGDGLMATADPRFVRVVLENLLENAWKFTSKRAQATIEIGSEAGEGGVQHFFVRDNGAGFDMAYANKLFGVFQRLHHEADFEGTGVGLATVERIVMRHGGRIWAQGTVGEGAVFRFTLASSEGM